MKFTVISGTVVDSEIWSQTHVKGSSSGISINGVGGSVGTTRSSVRNLTQIWVRTDDGGEVAVQTNPDWFSVRAGHRVTVLVERKGGASVRLVAGLNHNTGAKIGASGTPFIVLSILGFIFFSWFPAMLFGLNVGIGLIASAIFLLVIGRLFLTGMRINTAVGDFNRKTSVPNNHGQAVNPSGLEPT